MKSLHIKYSIFIVGNVLSKNKTYKIPLDPNLVSKHLNSGLLEPDVKGNLEILGLINGYYKPKCLCMRQDSM